MSVLFLLLGACAGVILDQAFRVHVTLTVFASCLAFALILAVAISDARARGRGER